MGNPVSKAVKVLEQQQDEAEKTVAANLQTLINLLDAKEQQFRSALINSKGEDKTIPIDTVVEMKSYKAVEASTAPSQQLKDTISELFGGNFLNSLQGLALTALDTVLGNAAGSAKEVREYVVMFAFNAIVRVDYMMYGYQVASHGVSDKRQSAICFVCIVSTVRLQDVNSEVIAYLLGSAAQKSRKFQLEKKAHYEARVLDLNKLIEVRPANKVQAVSERAMLVAELEVPIELTSDALGANEEGYDEKYLNAWITDRAKVIAALTSQYKVAIETLGDPQRAVTKEQDEMLQEMEDIYKKVNRLKLAMKKLSADLLE
jgi:hypothetical protein